jgi:hypothetical protein
MAAPRKIRPIAPACDVCAYVGGVQQFALTKSVKVGGRFTRRGVGSIRLCAQCWRRIAAPRRYAR